MDVWIYSQQWQQSIELSEKEKKKFFFFLFWMTQFFTAYTYNFLFISFHIHHFPSINLVQFTIRKCKAINLFNLSFFSRRHYLSALCSLCHQYSSAIALMLTIPYNIYRCVWVDSYVCENHIILLYFKQVGGDILTYKIENDLNKINLVLATVHFGLCLDLLLCFSLRSSS